MKKLLSILVAGLLLVSLIPSAAFAADNTVTIKTPEDLIALAENCVLDTWSEGKTIVLANDIDLSGTDFSPIPLFSGDFYGAGHTISGFTLDTDGTVTGFFRKITSDGSVENLNIKGTICAGDKSSTIGGFVGENQGVIKNCSFSGNVSGYEAVGGFCGINDLQGVIERVTVSGDVSGQHRIGGIAGESNGAIRYCRNRSNVNKDMIGEISADPSAIDLTKLNLTLSAEELVDITDIGGVAGLSAGVVRSCANEGIVGHRYVGYNIGGIVGRLSGYADTCTNSGKVYGRKDVGGIVGQAAPDTSWNYSTQKLTELQGKLETLRGSIKTLTADISSHSAALSQKLGTVTASLSNANTALGSIANDAVTFINENVGVINKLSDRITKTLSDFKPAFTTAGSALSGLPSTFDSLSGAIEGLSAAALIVRDTYNSMIGDIESASEAIAGIDAAINGIMEKITAFLSVPDMTKAPELLTAINSAMTTVNTEYATAKSHIGNIIDSLSNISGTDESLKKAKELANLAYNSLDSSFDAISGAGEQLSSAYDTLSGYDSLSFSPFNSESSSRGELFSSVSSAYTAFQSIVAELGGTWLETDVNAVSNDFIDLIKSMLEAISGFSMSAAQISDVSTESSDRTDGVIKCCRNTAQITAESNGGGIAGAISIDVSFDLEDEYHISSLLTGGMKYLVYALIDKCENSAAVNVKKDSAGGIVGRMDYGKVSNCLSGGEITANGDYAGGVAGLSEGTIFHCAARVNLSAEKYVGGIAGKGKNISNCLCMPNLMSDCACMGSVAGDAGGEVSGNYYGQSKIGGVNGFSYKGQAEQVAYKKLMQLSNNAPLFDSVRVTFIAEGEEVSVINVQFGGRVDKLPEVPDKDGKRWRWNDFDNTAVYCSMTVEGSYQSPITVLSTGEDTPQFLVEGDFTDQQELTVSQTETAEAADKTYTLSVNGYKGELKVRMLMKADGDLRVADGSGTFKKTTYTRDGSYIVFTLDNGGSLSFTEARSFAAWVYILIASGVTVLLIIAAVLIIRSRRRKRAKRMS